MKPLAFSYSFLNCFYEICPEQARGTYVTRQWKRSYDAKADGGVDAHKAFEQRIKYRIPLPVPFEHAEPFVQSFERMGAVEPEVQLAIDRNVQPVDFWDGWLRGKFDVVIRWRDKRKAFVSDWKTGKPRESHDQLELGALLLMANDSTVDTVTGVNVWLKTRHLGSPYTFTRATVDRLWAKWIAKMQAVERLDRNQEWEKRPGPLCNWCPVKSCEHYRERP